MSIKKIRDLQSMQYFTPFNEWNNGLKTNCIAYALGLMVDDPYKELFRTLLLEKPIEKLSKVFEALNLCYRQISSEMDLQDDEYGIVLYHYFYTQTTKLFGFEYESSCEETHLARIELDRTWTHKFGWDYNTSVTSPKEIHDIILHDDHVDVNPTAIFAVRKPQ